MSAPNSTALTTLTSPSMYNGSPEFSDNYEASPNFGAGSDYDGTAETWFPLFPHRDRHCSAACPARCHEPVARDPV